MKITTLLPSLLALFLFAIGCNTATTTNGTTDADGDGMETTTTTTTPAAATNDAVMSGDNYTVRVIDGEIKSPRKELKGQIDGVDITINYGSPAMNGRTIYGDLVPYGKVWRTGANEATRITFSGPVEVGDDVELPAGTYSLFTIPTDGDEWTVIFNKTAEQWGAYDYSEAQDAARIEADVDDLPEMAERMDFALDNENVRLMWANKVLSFEVEGESR